MNFASRFPYNLLFTVEGGYVRDPVLRPVAQRLWVIFVICQGVNLQAKFNFGTQLIVQSFIAKSVHRCFGFPVNENLVKQMNSTTSPLVTKSAW